MQEENCFLPYLGPEAYTEIVTWVFHIQEFRLGIYYAVSAMDPYQYAESASLKFKQINSFG